MTHKKKVIVGMLVVGALGASSFAWAGFKYTQTASVVVTLDGASGTATGDLGSTRNSADANEYIGCGVRVLPSGWDMHCQARDAFGDVGTCFSDDERMIQVASSLGTDGYVRFTFVNNECTELEVQHTSYQKPKAP
ncbi:hypothetical protein [Sorangium sp. So ce204]|uniref:hypothetical protein n=1 Tax=Sorangium sp. So ce204 TaxID=3133288 RepID=UPI003F635003